MKDVKGYVIIDPAFGVPKPVVLWEQDRYDDDDFGEGRKLNFSLSIPYILDF